MSTDSRIILGVGGTLGHDSNTALIVDGRLVAASQEERYSRRKHDSAFPEAAIRDCLAFISGDPINVDHCIFADKPLQSLIMHRLDRPSNWATWQLGKVMPENAFDFLRRARSLLPKAKFHYAWHHLAHASAAFATSPFDRAVFLCVDGQGDDVSATIGIADSRCTEILYELPYDHGIGNLYTLITEFLGFRSFGSEYKVMGLAPFGKPMYLEKLRSFIWSDSNGALRFNQRQRMTWASVYESLANHLGLRPRQKGEPLGEMHVNLAASIQALFEAQICKMAAFAQRVTGEDFLLFCGGCAQNCVVSGMLRDSDLFKGVFTSPAAGDMGTGLGAALLYRQKIGVQGDGKIDMAGCYLGSLPGDLPHETLQYRINYQGNIFEAAARLIADGKIIGWVRGRMELGARALGARSILADPRVPDMQSVLNQKIKFRESFRPFAPAILAERCSDWFDSNEPSDYMQYTAHLKPEHRHENSGTPRDWRDHLDFRRCDFSSIVHIDFSARLQTVRRDLHPEFHRLITEFEKLTGVPMIINTSFNLSGEPIVRTAAEAWQCFRHTEIDFLIVGDILLHNPCNTSEEEKVSWLKQFEEHS